MKRTVNHELVDLYTDGIRPLLPQARRAYGASYKGSATRDASDRVNALLTEYVEAGGNLTHLANALAPDISLAGLRRRVRSARSGGTLGRIQNLSKGSNTRGSRDPHLIQRAAEKITVAREEGTDAYARAVKEAYDSGVSLAALAKHMEISYFALYAAKQQAAA